MPININSSSLFNGKYQTKDYFILKDQNDVPDAPYELLVDLGFPITDAGM